MSSCRAAGWCRNKRGWHLTRRHCYVSKKCSIYVNTAIFCLLSNSININFSSMIISKSPLQFQNIKLSHRLTVLAGKDDLRAPSGVYHISWYPGANSCLMKDNTNSEKICKRVSVVSDIRSPETAAVLLCWNNVDKYAEQKQQETVEMKDFLLQPRAHKTFTLTETKPDCFKDLDKNPLTDNKRYKEECCD